MRLSLRSRLVLSLVVVIVITAGLVAVLANRITADRFTYFISGMGRMQAYQLAPLFAEYYSRVGSWEGVDVLLRAVLESPPQGSVMWGQGGMMGMMGRTGTVGCTETTGQSATTVQSICDDRLLLADLNGRVVADSEGQSVGFELAPEELGQGAPIMMGEFQIGTLLVASGLGTLTPDQRAFLSQINWLMAGAAVVAGLAVLIVGSWQARRILAPVRALADAARRVAAGDFARVPVTSQDELGEMAQAFNTMAAELEQQHELRRRAMADIAHELRTPLSVLQIDLESIEDGLTDPKPEVIGRLQDEVGLLNRLVEDLRMLSLAESGELHLEIRPVDTVQLVQSAVGRMRGAVQEKGLRLEVELPEHLPVVMGDEQRLSQVLLNLMNNAVTYTPAGGQVSVSAWQEEGEVRVVVRDTGEGIPADEVSHVFERFYRTDRARSRETGGTGLGLAIARGLAEAHGGRIWVESVVGEGSTFTLALPVGSD